METDRIILEIRRLKKEKNVVVLAHYYQADGIQEIADFTGDSLALSKQAKTTDADVIVFCGVLFMAETAKILSPRKTVLLPAIDAGCPMADMVTPEDIRRFRALFPKAAVVCYVNSTCAVKAESDVCVTSANAVKIVKALDEKQIIFVPDQNLGGYVARQVPEKEVILHSGYCPVHHRLSVRDVEKAKAAAPEALLLAHPECREAVLDQADFVGSTEQILGFAKQSEQKEFLIATESGTLYELRKNNPDKTFYPLTQELVCADMKKTTLQDLYSALLYGRYEIELDAEMMDRARHSLDRMLELA